jgi:hypothetical protein
MFDLIGGDPDLRDLLDPSYLKTVPRLPGAERGGRTDGFYIH